MLKFSDSFRVTHHGSTVLLFNLDKRIFLKLNTNGWELVKKYIETKDDSILEKLNEKDRKGMEKLLVQLHEQQYIYDASKTEKKEVNESTLKEKFIKKKKSAYFSITSECNLGCRFCYASPPVKVKKFWGDLELSKKIIDKTEILNIKNLVISGGEPLLREDVFDLIKYAKKKVPRVLMTTNGTLIDEETAIKLKETGIDSISISCENQYREIHDGLRGKGTYDKVMNGVQYLKSAGFNKDSLNLIATITSKNINSLPGFIEFTNELGVSMNFSLFQQTGRGTVNKDLQFSDQQYLEFLRTSLENNKGGILPEESDSSESAISIDRLSGDVIPAIKNICGMVSGMLGIRDNGDIVPCHLFFAAKDKKMIIGNILEDSILDKMWSFHKTIPSVDEKEGCRTCNVRYFCGGACFAPGYYKDGHFGTANPTCEPLKKYYGALADCLGTNNEGECLFEKINSFCNM